MFGETKVGWYHGELSELVRHYSNNFTQVPVGRRDVAKYFTARRYGGQLYHVSVSNCEQRTEDYNLIALVFGPRPDLVSALMRSFEERLPIKLKKAPEFLEEQNKVMMMLISIMGGN
jgi:hypothetical protein